ncbi:MAG: hypothetical protein C4308_08780 [Chitinophagaceae bacterium]
MHRLSLWARSHFEIARINLVICHGFLILIAFFLADQLSKKMLFSSGSHLCSYSPVFNHNPVLSGQSLFSFKKAIHKKKDL